MTDRTPPPPAEPNRMAELARKRARLVQLSDPLGAMGFRATGARVEREGQARRLLFAATMGALAGTGVAVAVAGGHAATGGGSTPAAQTAAPAQQIVAEIPAGIDPQTGKQVMIRVLQPAQPARQTHARTRQS